MGLFDFFKKKKTVQEEAPGTEAVTGQTDFSPTSGKSLNDIYAARLNSKPSAVPSASTAEVAVVQKYAEYVMCFINMQLNGNYSPIAAFENIGGDLTGYLYFSNDLSYNLSIAEVIGKMESEFETRLAAGIIKSYAILYHSQFDRNGKHDIANREDEFGAISVKYKTNEGLQGYAALPYFFEGEDLTFKGFAGFTPEQSNAVMDTPLNEGKDYFQERVEIKQEVLENEAGIKIKEVNNATLGNMWRGILGYERVESPHGNQLFKEYMALALSRDEKAGNDEVRVSEYAYGDIIFRAVKTRDERTATVYPNVKTSYSIPVTTKQIDVWVHSGSIEAVITGSGHDTFGLKFFATDFALNKQRYHSTKNLQIALSGIALVLDESKMEEDAIEGATLRPDFTTYMPNKELAHMGCFDFIGVLENFREVTLLEDSSVQGYIARIKLINDTEEPDLFTIDMFVNKENMRFKRLTKGMKVSGLFQLLGEIVD